jgi:hypothetical protein
MLLKKGVQITIVNTLGVSMDQSILPWEFNFLPFVTIAESPQHLRLKIGWLWFYIVFLRSK